MKTGRTLEDLAREIMRQQESKKDLIATTKAVEMTVGEDQGKPVAQLDMGPAFGRFTPNGLANDQIGVHTGIPGKYYDKMLAEAPGLLADNVNHWFKQNPAARLFRTLDGRVRAFLSDTYRPLENYDLAAAVLPILGDMKLEVMSCEVTERRLYIKAVDQRLKDDVPYGHKMGDGSHKFFDTCSPAIIISNSEVGAGTLSIDSGIYTKVCTNMCMIAEGGMKRRHVGSRNALTDGEEIRHLLSDKTKRATDKAIWLQVSDVVRNVFNEDSFKKHTAKMKQITGNEIDAKADVTKVVELAAKKIGYTETESRSVLQHLIKGGDLSQYGLFNAVTRTAQDVESYDRATELEAMGNAVLELPRTDWERIARAA